MSQDEDQEFEGWEGDLDEGDASQFVGSFLGGLDEDDDEEDDFDDVSTRPSWFARFLPAIFAVACVLCSLGLIILGIALSNFEDAGRPTPPADCREQCRPYAMSHLDRDGQCFCDLTKKTPEGIKGTSDAEIP